MAGSSDNVVALSTIRPKESNLASETRQAASMEDDQERFELQTWCQRIRTRLQQFVKLDHGWDGYDADPISIESAMFAFEVMMQMWRTNLQPPDVSPLSDGSIMFEWNQNGRHVTIEVHEPYSISFLSTDIHVPNGMIATDLSALTKLARYLVEGEDPPRRAIAGC
jgi:hypothetical protein